MKIKTYLGELDVEYLYKNNLGYFAITGDKLSRRSWMITKEEYEKLSKEKSYEIPSILQHQMEKEFDKKLSELRKGG